VILVDTSVWVDYFRGTATPQTDTLDRLLGVEPLVIGDLILIEVLQGFATQRDFDRARRMLGTFELVVLGGQDVAIVAAQFYRRLRGLGVTVRKTIDTIIATRCIVGGYALLHDDADFEPFARHLGLRSVDCSRAARVRRPDRR
jgi:predicted nucleic acid-binding protein